MINQCVYYKRLALQRKREFGLVAFVCDEKGAIKSNFKSCFSDSWLLLLWINNNAGSDHSKPLSLESKHKHSMSEMAPYSQHIMQYFSYVDILKPFQKKKKWRIYSVPVIKLYNLLKEVSV